MLTELSSHLHLPGVMAALMTTSVQRVCCGQRREPEPQARSRSKGVGLICLYMSIYPCPPTPHRLHLGRENISKIKSPHKSKEYVRVAFEVRRWAGVKSFREGALAAPEFGITQLKSPLGKVVDLNRFQQGEIWGPMVAEECSPPASQGRATLGS